MHAGKRVQALVDAVIKRGRFRWIPGASALPVYFCAFRALVPGSKVDLTMDRHPLISLGHSLNTDSAVAAVSDHLVPLNGSLFPARHILRRRLPPGLCTRGCSAASYLFSQ